MFRVDELANMIATELEGCGFTTRHSNKYVIVDETWTEDDAVILQVGNETIRLTISRHT